MRCLAVAAVGILVAGMTGGHAQQADPVRPTFRAGTTLIDFNIVAVDGRGNPVTNLRRDEITIFEDDQNRELAFYQYEGAASSSVRGPSDRIVPLAPGTFTNRTQYAPHSPRNLIAIVLDLINTTIAQQAELQTHLLHSLKQLPPDAHVGLYIVSEQALAIHDFTKDVDSLRARLEKGSTTVQTALANSSRDIQAMLKTASAEHAESLKGMAEARARAEGDLDMHIMKLRRRRTLQALEAVGHHLAGVPGRKSIVWVTYGFPLTSHDGTYTDEVRTMSQQLATENVAIYPVDAGGVGGTSLGGGGGRQEGRIQGTNELMASITGGRVTRNNNDLTSGMHSAADDLRGAYSVGFYGADKPDDRWHTLTVKTSRPDVTLRYREGYLAASTVVNEKSVWPKDRWNDLAYRPLISTAVRIDARPSREAARLILALDVAVDDLEFRPASGGSASDVEIALVEKTAKGPTNVRVQPASVQRPPDAAVPATVPLSATFPLNPQTTSVRVIVRDRASGRFGSLDLQVDRLPKP